MGYFDIRFNNCSREYSTASEEDMLDLLCDLNTIDPGNSIDEFNAMREAAGSIILHMRNNKIDDVRRGIACSLDKYIVIYVKMLDTNESRFFIPSQFISDSEINKDLIERYKRPASWIFDELMKRKSDGISLRDELRDKTALFMKVER